LPAALQGFDVDAMLAGAREVDALTRHPETRKNPAALLALMWHWAGGGRGLKDMVILPYKDRLELLSKYLQQLVMESLGKERDLAGQVVHQGIAVYGNKGSTDQHAYVQQLREGVPNFFATFFEVLRDRAGGSMTVEDDATSGDYLSGFLLGTRRALYENARESVTITIPEVSARTVGGLIALYERAVGLYASLTNINAYHQPGVEAGKRAATAVLALQARILKLLGDREGQALGVEAIAEALGARDEAETVFKILEHAAANPDHGVKRQSGRTPFDATYSR
jgi:glucose-6-phosphate isomerase